MFARTLGASVCFCCFAIVNYWVCAFFYTVNCIFDRETTELLTQFFLLFIDLHFVHGFHMCCVNSLAHIFVCFLKFWLYVCNCSLALFFETFLRTVCLFFWTNNSYLHLVCFCRFLSVVVPRFAQLYFVENSFFFAPGIIPIYFFVSFHLWCLGARFCLLFLLVSHAVCLWLKNNDLRQFKLACFRFFWCFLLHLCNCILVYIYSLHATPFPCHDLPPMTLSDHRDHPWQLALLFRPWHTCEIYPEHAEFGFFFPCFAVRLCLWDPMHPLEPICTHPEVSLLPFAFIAKTWCPGKFPRP